MSSIFGGLNNLAEKITSLPSQIGDFLLNGIKDIFIPDTVFIQEQVEILKQRFLQIGVGFYDMTDIFNVEKPFEDITATINGREVVIVNMDIATKVVAHFRGIIRGLMILLLGLYNYNQFMGFIGQQGLSLGTHTLIMDKGGKT